MWRAVGIAVFVKRFRRGNDYVLSLDNDARIDRQSDRRISEAVADSDPRIGVVGPKTYSDDGSGRIQCAGGRITLYAKRLFRAWGWGKAIAGQYDKIEDVDYFPGFGFMARREVFEKLNFVDEAFYGYGHEDTDFCLRAAQLGYRVVYVPKALMWHRGSTTIGDYSPTEEISGGDQLGLFRAQIRHSQRLHEVRLLCRFWPDLCARRAVPSGQS